MTVTRCSTAQFNTDATAVADALAAILNEGQKTYKYSDLEFSDSGMSVATVIKPNSWPLLLSTRLFVQVDATSDGLSLVTAKTKSQWFILGDVFNYYNGYLKDFLGSLQCRCTDSPMSEK